VPGGHRLSGCASIRYVAANQVGPLQKSWLIDGISATPLVLNTMSENVLNV